MTDGARPLSGVLRSADQVLTAVRARKDGLALSDELLGELAGYASGSVGKYIGPARLKSPTLSTLYLMLEALGLGLVLVEDPGAAARMRHRWTRRRESTVRPPDKVARVAVQRARPVVLQEAARKAAAARWAATSKKDRSAFVAMLNAARAAKRTGRHARMKEAR